MTMTMTRSGNELTVALDGRLDTLTAPDLEEQLEPALEGVEKLVFDFEKLAYISSAGLRVLLDAMQAMEEQGEMVVRNVGPEVMDVFQVTLTTTLLWGAVALAIPLVIEVIYRKKAKEKRIATSAASAAAVAAMEESA